MDSKFGKDFSKGSIPRHLIHFSVPILIGTLVTTGYSIINAIWVGKLLGKEAIGAVAVVYPVILILVAMTTGLNMAASILISQKFGAKDNEMIQKITDNAWSVAAVIVFIVSALGIIFSPEILSLLKTPIEVMPFAVIYLRVTFIGFVFMFFSGLIVSILRGIGDTATPTIFMIISTLINAVLDPVLIMGLGPVPKLNLLGAGIASLMASGSATLMGIVYMRCKYSSFPINPRHIRFDKQVTASLFKIGFPSFIKWSLISISYGFITTFVNDFGSVALAAFGVTNRIDSLAIMPGMAVASAVSTLTAQNIGADKPERIKEIFKWGLIINIVITMAISVIVVSFPKILMHLFVDDLSVIDTGIGYLRIVGAGYTLFAISYVSNGIIDGAGKTMITMLISFVSLCIIRIPLAAIVSKSELGLQGIWGVIVISFGVTAVSSLIYYFAGGWKKRLNFNEKRILLERG